MVPGSAFTTSIGTRWKYELSPTPDLTPGLDAERLELGRNVFFGDSSAARSWCPAFEEV